MIKGLSHMTFIVSDLDRMSTLLVEGLGATEIYSSGDKTFSHSREKFFDLGGLWVAAMEGEALPSRTYNHIAFEVNEEAIDSTRARLEKIGVEVLPDRPRIEGEGRSLYFYDFDNHLFELHTGTLEQRLNSYANQ
ncbi:FosX/FosE/FosI family fosfomycin resistance hydrolase [Pseudovibrio sp. SPO723]|uniref:FosX/FosE/FosI family fosfomycin resistance hydrolase n=1 Tax=Nesiotobacter zosterae TaxID=392721 RepID=UPI0029C2A7EA|nr:FosX/FosE/FosI family fosfomycin resistance hydrolase [Pseudovibrio sp. SPO723]MDX5594770.1 FosX/FosE/FosI family fosfomycin resistance hydrolase [Pseudovibrio sp. SPO723]